MAQIIVENVCKYYEVAESRNRLLLKLLLGRKREPDKNYHALDDVSFSVEPGSCLGLIGRNGSGKSTLLRMLAGIVEPSSGRVQVNGRLSTVLDVQSGLHPRLTGVQNIFLKGAFHHLSKKQIRERKDSIIEFSGLGKYINSPIHTYSSGMVIRLGFSIALHMDFDILLMDEILAVGDIVFQRHCLARVKQFLEEGKTIVIATHNLGDVSAVCNRVLLLKKGKVVHDGESEQVLKDYWTACEKAQNTIPRAMHQFKPENIYGTDTKEIEITGVTFTNENDESCDTFHTGESLRVTVHFHAKAPTMQPLFRLQIFSNTGILVYGLNTSRIGMDTGEISGDGVMTIEYPCLNLLEGDYYFTVGIWPDEYRSTMTDIAYDCHQWRYIIRIRSDRENGAGMAYNQTRWKLVNNGRTVEYPENAEKKSAGV